MGIKSFIQGLRRPTVAATPDIASTLDVTKARASARIVPARPPRLRSIGNHTYGMPPQRSFAANPDAQGVGGPANAAAGGDPKKSAADRTQFAEIVQPSWHHESIKEETGKAARSKAPLVAGIVANNFRGLGDNHGGRQ